MWTVPARKHPITLQEFQWAHKTMLAPLDGVGHPLFRQMVAEHGGVGIVCTEFVRIGTNPVNEKSMRSHVIKAMDLPLSVQVMGTHVETMADAAGMVAQAGADVVDINLGCPSPRVVRKGAGSAMLKDPELLYHVLCGMRERVPGLLSAKIRAGFEESDTVVQNALTVQAAGADFLVVHPRRRCDFYQGVADWRIVRTLKEALDIPVVGNGDVWYACDIQRMRDETHCDAVMLGRPAMRNPWIFQQAAALKAGETPFSPSGPDVVQWLLDMRRRYADEFDFMPRGPIGKLKEILTYIGRAVRDENHFRTTVLRINDLDEMMAYVESYLSPLTSTDLDLEAVPSDPLERSGEALAEKTVAEHERLVAPVDEAGEASGWI